MSQFSKPQDQCQETLEKLKEIIYYIKLGNEALKNLPNKQIAILVLGEKGAGKSAACNFLVGRTMAYYDYVYDEVKDKDLNDTIQSKKKFIIAQDSVFKIGHSESSETSVIQVSYMSQQNKYLVCDCPGFFDSRSEEMEIAHSVCLENFLQKCQTVIPIVLIPYYRIDQTRDSQINKQLQTIINFLTNLDSKIFNQFLFLYTHTEKNTEIEDIKQKLQIFNKSTQVINQNKNEDNIKQKYLLNTLIKQIDENKDILILNPTKNNLDDYLKLIEKQNPFQNPKDDFCVSFSENAFKSMSLHIEKVKNYIHDLLDENKYQAIIEVILTLKELVDCMQSKFQYLNKEYLDCQKLVENNIQIKYNEAIDSITKSNQENVIIMDKNFEKINLLLEYLTIIYSHKQIIFIEFSITKDLLEQTIKEKCHEIKQSAINNLTSDFGNSLIEAQQSCISNSTNMSVEFEKTKQNMQNLLNMSKQIKEIKEINDIFNECKKQVLDAHKIYYQELQDKLKQLFKNREQSNDKKESEIEQITYQFVKLQNSEKFLSPFFQQHDEFNFYNKITEQADIFNKENLYYIQNFTSKYDIRFLASENQIEQNQHIDNHEKFQRINSYFIDDDYKRLPNYEMQTFQLLDSHQQFKQHLKEFEKDYSSSRNILQQFLQNVYESITKNCSNKKISSHIKKEIDILDSIRNIDQVLEQNIQPSYSAFKTELQKGIKESWDSIKNHFKKYKVSAEVESELKDEDTLENTFIKEVYKIYKYFNNMKWTEQYLKTQKVVTKKIEKIQKSLKNYLEFLFQKSQEFVKNNKYENLNPYLKKFKYIKNNIQIPGINTEIDDMLNPIYDALNREIQKNENEFQEQEKTFKDIQSLDLDLNKLNICLAKLFSIKKLNEVPEYCGKAETVIQNIKELIIKYFAKIQNFIDENNDIDKIEKLINDSSMKKQIDFISKIKDIPSENNEINNCFEDQKKEKKKIFEKIDTIYDNLIKYYDFDINKQNLNQKIKTFEIITKYYDEFKIYSESIYQKQQNLPNPKQIVKEIIQNIQIQIKNQQYEEIATNLQYLQDLKLAENDVQSCLQTLYNKIETNLSDLKNIINDFLVDEYIDMTFEEFKKQYLKLIEQIKQISRIFEQQSKQNSIAKISMQKGQTQLFISETIQKQINNLKEIAKIQNFTKMESKYKTLYLFINQLNKIDYFFNQNINYLEQQQQNIEDMFKNVEFNFIQNVEFFNKLNIMLKNDSSQFHQMYVNMKNDTERRIKSFLAKDIEQINNSIQSDELSKAKKELEQIKQKISYLKEEKIYFDENQIQEIDDKFTSVIQGKSGKLEQSIQDNNYQETIKLLNLLHKNDQTYFNKKILVLQDQMKKNIDAIENNYIKLSSEDITQKLKKINFIKEVLKEFPITHNLNILKELKQKIVQKILTQLEDLERFLKSDKDYITEEINIADLFKIQNFLKLFQENDNKTEDIQFHNQFKKINELKKCLDDALQSLLKDQTKLINEINSKKDLNSFYSKVILTTKKFDNFIEDLVKDNQKVIDANFNQFLNKILNSHKLDESIQNQIQSYENQIDKAWKQSEYTTVKNAILTLNKISTFNDVYQLKINNIIQKYSNLKNGMTIKAQQSIKEEQYDQELNQLINNIYSAEETLKDIDQFGYSAQSQINLIRDLIKKQLQDITKQSPFIYQEGYIQTSEQILIKLQKIADKISRFSSIIKEEQESFLDKFLKIYQQSGVISLGQILNETTEGRYIVNGIKIFEQLVVENFNKRVAMHDLPYILDNIQISEEQKEIKKLNGDQLSCLNEYYQIYESTYKEQLNKYVLKDKAEIVEIVNSIFSKNKISIENWNDSTKKIIAEALGNICAYWTLEKSSELTSNQNQISWYTPTQAQILSVMMLLGLDSKQSIIQSGGNFINLFTPFENKIIEILTGEGKSLALAFCSILFAKIGCSVDVVCYSKYLSSRDNDDFSQLFKKFGVKEKIMYGNFEELVEKHIKIIGDLRDLTKNAINNSLESYQQQQQNQNEYSGPKILLIDEVDVFCYDELYGNTNNPSIHLSSPQFKNIIREIWKMKTEKQMGNPKQIKDSIMQSNDYNQLINYCPQIKQFIERQISLLSEEVQSFENNKHEYIVKDDQIGYKKLDNSYCFNTSYRYTTLFTYFKLQASNKISQNTLDNNLSLGICCGNLSYALIPNIYQNILGVTGTLKSLNSSMKDIIQSYQIKKQIYIPSMYGKSNRDFNDKEYVIVEDNINEQFLKVREIAQQYHQKQQSVLIFFKSKNEIDKFLKSQNQIIPHDQYNKIIEDTHDISNQVKSATQKKAISLCVREYGRGMDFVCFDDEIEKNGGVVVIQTFLSEDKTEEIQIQGRTARQGKKGKYYLILDEQDITATFKVNSEQINNWKKDQSNKTLFQNLAVVRDNLWNKTYQVKVQQVKQSNEKHNETLQYLKALQNRDMEKVFQFINKNG